MRKFLALIITFCMINNGVFALDNLDLSVDDEIRKKYNVNDVSLPPLPKIESGSYKEVIIEPSVSNLSNKKSNDKNIDSKTTVLKSGAKFKLKSLSDISDRTKSGTKVSFVLLSPVTTTGFTIPMNTVIYGKVMKTHSPQITGNGGLIVVRLHSFKMNGNTYYLDGRVLKANKKHIFLNNIKGERKYLQSIPKTMRWGRNYKNKMYKLTGKFAKDKVTMIFCPFSFLFGTIGYVGNLVVSPVAAIKYKGGRAVLKKGSLFVFKLTEDVSVIVK